MPRFVTRWRTTLRSTLLRVSLIGIEPLASDIAAILSPSSPERPRPAILAAVMPSLSGPAARIVTASVVAGERTAAVSNLAVLCNVSVRTLEARCRAAGILAPKPLLGWMLALHTTWRITRWGWSAQSAAEAAGIRSADALSDRMQRATGLRLTHACRDVGFEELLQRFTETLTVARQQSTGGRSVAKRVARFGEEVRAPGDGFVFRGVAA